MTHRTVLDIKGRPIVVTPGNQTVCLSIHGPRGALKGWAYLSPSNARWLAGQLEAIADDIEEED